MLSCSVIVDHHACLSCISFEAHRERQSEEREMNKATRRKLVHDPSLFFDILGEGKH
jgi:hypothetical protein